MRQLRRPIAGAGVAAMVVSGLVAATNGAAQAAGGPKQGVVVHSTGVETAADAQQVRDFWTPERMREAVPLSGEMTDTALVKAKDKPSKPDRPGKGEGDGVAGAPWTGGGDVVRTNGVLFFLLDGTPYTCSASVVEAANESTVVTAGHCLHNGQGDDPENYAEFVEFVPGIPDGSGGGTFTAPADEWVASHMLATDEWVASGDTDYDVGMIVVRQVGGASLADTIGAAPGIRFFDDLPAEPVDVHAFGYPTSKPYSGAELAYCAGTPADEPERGTDALRLECNMGSGSSGGPWLEGFGSDRGNPLGVMVAVTSFGYEKDKKGIYGPYFGAEALEVYQAAEGTQVG